MRALFLVDLFLLLTICHGYFPLQSQFGEAQAKELKIKQSQLAKAKAEPDINPNLIQVSDRTVKERKEQEVIPEIEWW